MKKILFGINDNRLSKGALEFIRHLNEKQTLEVTGVYIPSLINDLAWVTPGGEDALFVPRLVEEDEALVRGNIQGFKDFCSLNRIKFSVQGDIGQSIPDGIQKETRFADLFILGFESFCFDSEHQYLDEDLRQLVRMSECPVLLIPEKAEFPDNIIVAYDGSASSVYALKMFSYILPSMCNTNTMIAHANLNATAIPEEQYIRDLVAGNFPNSRFSLLELDPKRYFITWLEDQPRSLLVTGSYGRSELSQLFKRSFIGEILEGRDLPVFIAHR